MSYNVAPDADSKAIGGYFESIADLEEGGNSDLASRLAAVQDADKLIDLLSVLIAIADSKLEHFRTEQAWHNHS